MSERLARMEEIVRATEEALASLHDGEADRIEAAVQACELALQACVSAEDSDLRYVADPEEKARLQEAAARLNELTQLSFQEASRVRDAVSAELQRANELRHFLDATRLAASTKGSQFDQEG